VIPDLILIELIEWEGALSVEVPLDRDGPRKDQSSVSLPSVVEENKPARFLLPGTSSRSPPGLALAPCSDQQDAACVFLDDLIRSTRSPRSVLFDPNREKQREQTVSIMAVKGVCPEQP